MPKVNYSKRDVLVGVPALIECENVINRKTWAMLCSGQKESTLNSFLNSVFQEQIMVSAV